MNGPPSLLPPPPTYRNPAATHFACPTCSQVDMVQKVSVLHSGGIYDTSQTGVTVGLARPLTMSPANVIGAVGVTSSHGKTQSRLSALFAPPRMSTHGVNDWLAAAIALVVLGIGFVVSALLVFGFWYEFTAAATGQAPPKTSSFALIPAAIGTILAALGVAALALGAWLGRKNSLKNMEVAPRNRAAWEAANYRWNCLYFCSRDETVFNPWTKKAAPLTHLATLLAPDA